MQDINWFRRKLLELFQNQKECFRNIFQPHAHYLKSWLESEPNQAEIQLAQKAFRSLVEDGLIYDATGDNWFAITDSGRQALKETDPPPVSFTVEEYLSKYCLHPKIHAVSAKLFMERNYKEAIQAALVEVISRVKHVSKNPKDSSGHELDGDTLMQKAFGCDGAYVPLIKLNNLKDSLDDAEQRGFMYIFKGIVGIRDKKAHLNFIQKDPNKTLEYLCTASLLMRLLEDDFVKQFNASNVQNDLPLSRSASAKVEKSRSPKGLLYLSRKIERIYSLAEVFNKSEIDLLGLDIALSYENKNGRPCQKSGRVISHPDHAMRSTPVKPSILRRKETFYIMDFPRTKTVVTITGREADTNKEFTETFNLEVADLQ